VRDFGEESNPTLELAYALTIHKAQGSEFNLTFVVLPNPCGPLSRELLYTALTRQRNRIISLHQGERHLFKRFASDYFSASALRLTNLLRSPSPVTLLIVPMDLPQLMAADLQQIIALGRAGPCVALAPAQRDGGPNALLVNPPGLTRYAFGEQSFLKHRQQSEQNGARVEIYYSERVAWDVEQPEDLGKVSCSSVRDPASRLERDQQTLKALQH